MQIKLHTSFSSRAILDILGNKVSALVPINCAYFLKVLPMKVFHCVTLPTAILIRHKTYQCRRSESANYACAVGRCCTEFPRLYLGDKEVERPSGSLTEAHKSVGICLVQRCELLYLLAGEK